MEIFKFCVIPTKIERYREDGLEKKYMEFINLHKGQCRYCIIFNADRENQLQIYFLKISAQPSVCKNKVFNLYITTYLKKISPQMKDKKQQKQKSENS